MWRILYIKYNKKELSQSNTGSGVIIAKAADLF